MICKQDSYQHKGNSHKEPVSHNKPGTDVDSKGSDWIKGLERLSKIQKEKKNSYKSLIPASKNSCEDEDQNIHIDKGKKIPHMIEGISPVVDKFAWIKQKKIKAFCKVKLRTKPFRDTIFIYQMENKWKEKITQIHQSGNLKKST